MFSNAKTIKTAKPSKKQEKEEIGIANLETYAAIDSLIKTLTGLKESLEGEIKTDVRDHFLNKGIALKARPENFKGFEGKATASCEMRARSSRSPLSDDDALMLQGYGITVEKAEDVAETFVINPAYKDDQALLSKIEAKLSTIKDLPQDFIMKQEGVSRKIVGSTAINEVFALAANYATADEATASINMLLPIVSVIALKPVLEVEIKEALAMVSKHFGE